MLHAAYLENLTVSEVLGHKTPYEALLRNAPKNSDIRIFGGTAFINLQTAEKFEILGSGIDRGIRGFEKWSLSGVHLYTNRILETLHVLRKP